MPSEQLTLIEVIVLTAYYALLAGLCLFGAHRLWLVFEFLWLRGESTSRSSEPAGQLPSVTIQLPLYNEPLVCERLIDAVCQIDYPASRLSIQVLDDSTDDTTVKCATLVENWQKRGINIQHIKRQDRTGYKAGALQFGLERCNSDLIAVFDADFIPQPDFLQCLVGHFSDERVGMVQSSWGHINERASLLTRLQALFLNAHFKIEHEVRYRRDRFFNFNGTAGIWRRTAIIDAGGWQQDTLTEDLDLSYRAQLRGWKFVYRNDVVSPAELPEIIDAYRSQQHRWSKGSIETARKILPDVLKSKESLSTKVDAVAHLTGNAAYLMLIVLLLLMFPMFIIREEHGFYSLTAFDGVAFVPTLLGFAVFFAVAARAAGRSWFSISVLVPCALALGVGLSLNNGFAALEGIMGRRSAFVRTMKRGNANNSLSERLLESRGNIKQALLPVIELVMSAYLILLAATAVLYEVYIVLPFVVLFAAGFLCLSLSNIIERIKRSLHYPNMERPTSLPSGVQ